MILDVLDRVDRSELEDDCLIDQRKVDGSND